MQKTAVSLTLADGTCWNILAEDLDAAKFVTRLADVMRLGSPNGDGRTIHVRIQGSKQPGDEKAPMPETLRSFLMDELAGYPGDDEYRQLKTAISCNFHENNDGILEPLRFMQLSSVFVLDAMTRGGMLFHGALIERDSLGVILAGPCGVGKTTACNRLPEPWKALSDDSTLIVRDTSGDYWAHPWPTWSRFLMENGDGSWDVRKGVFVKAICFLSQSPKLELIPLGEGEMVILGMASTDQASRALDWQLDVESVRKMRNICFRNVCQMVKVIPGYRLKLDLKSPFYTLIEDHFLKT
jgi:SynChlorMet cassette protein ScmC